MDEPTDEELTLAALDLEIDPPISDWEFDFIETWRAFEHGGPEVLRLEYGDPWDDEELWDRRLAARRARHERLAALPAPTRFMLREEALVAQALAGLAWAHYRKTNVVLDQPDDTL